MLSQFLSSSLLECGGAGAGAGRPWFSIIETGAQAQAGRQYFLLCFVCFSYYNDDRQ